MKNKILFKLTTYSSLVVVATLFFFASPKPVYAILLCADAGTPWTQIDVAGYGTFSSSGNSSSNTINNIPSETVLNFTVRTYAQPSSYNNISYPNNKFQTYPGPSSAGRPYPDADPITSDSSITVYILQNCEFDGTTPEEMNYPLNLNIAPPPGPVCGDGEVNGTEQCDNGTASNGSCPKSCSNSCTINNCSGKIPVLLIHYIFGQTGALVKHRNHRAQNL